MSTFTDLLPPTKAGTPALAWEKNEDPYSPLAGKLVIDTREARDVYAVTEFPVGWPGRGFHMAKVGGGAYDVFVSLHGPEADSCDCAAASYGAPTCRHRAAVRTLIGNGWI